MKCEQLDKVMSVLIQQLDIISTTDKKGEELNEILDKSRMIGLLACQYVSADSQQLRRQMLENQQKKIGFG